MKVLIVDDNKAVRRMIASFIEDVVDEFVECEDGGEVRAAYTAHRPDLVLMDVKMRRVDGLQATREIKTSFPDARVVIVSQWDSPALREAAAEAGAEDYITKKDLFPLRNIVTSK